MKALNLEVEYPSEALPGWANRWAYDYHTGSIIPVKFVNGLAWISSPNDYGSIPQVPTGIVILDSPYSDIERLMWIASAACLLSAFIVNIIRGWYGY